MDHWAVIILAQPKWSTSSAGRRLVNWRTRCSVCWTGIGDSGSAMIRMTEFLPRRKDCSSTIPRIRRNQWVKVVSAKVSQPSRRRATRSIQHVPTCSHEVYNIMYKGSRSILYISITGIFSSCRICYLLDFECCKTLWGVFLRAANFIQNTIWTLMNAGMLDRFVLNIL